MATPSKSFTNIPDASVDAESPLDTTLMTQIRDSLIHLEEWAGKNYTAAIDHDHDGVNSKLPAVTNLDVLASDVFLLGSADTEMEGGLNSSYVKKKEIVLGQITGTLRIKFDMQRSFGTVYGRVYRNGVAVGTQQSTTSTSYVTFSEDVSGWSPGDLIQLYMKDGGGVADGNMKNFRLYADRSYNISVILN